YTEAKADYDKAEEFARGLGDRETRTVALSGQVLSSYFIEDYVNSLGILDQMLALDPDDLWALKFKADLLSEFAEYEDAILLLQRTALLDPSNSETFASMGWGLENVGAQRAEEAKQAYENAIALSKDNLWAHKGVGNALVLLGQPGAAAEKYRYVIEEANKRGEDNALIGWCQYRLGQYEDAARTFEKGLDLDPGTLSSWFDLALAQMCGGKYDSALQNYLRGLEIVQPKHPFKRRGLLFIALDDVKEALREQPNLATAKEFQEAMRRLKMAWKEVETAATGPTALNAGTNRKTSAIGNDELAIATE
ncbi:MAG TPA: tetratricopeptide repeat protein, partial [Anaerolineales bacterium]|nr:tetratricopeptide repeat protein [Anaerolineales bacterium]